VNASGPSNTAPTADAGADDECTLPSGVTLDGAVSDDGLPSSPGTVTATWSKVSGPGTVTFGDDNSLTSTASFSAAGTYVLQLEADDGDLTDTDTVEIAVNAAESGTGAFLEDGGTVVMEAEHYDDNDTGNSDGWWMEESSYTGYVGEGYMKAPTHAHNETWADGGAEMDYAIDITDAGTYRIYMRRYHANPGGQNSCHVGLDGVGLGAYDNQSLTQNEWVWPTTNLQMYLSAGTHTLHIRRQESWYRIDRIVLTTNTSWSPSGTGPAESSRSGAPENTAPTTDAGSDDTITYPAAASLDGTVSDDGMPASPGSVTVTWSKISGPGTVSFGNTHAVDTTATFSQNGVYVLQLEADDGALTDSDTVQITVNQTAPTADAGADDDCTIPAGVSLDGTVSDDGMPASPGSVTVTWSKVSGPGTVTFGNTHAVDTTAEFSQAGTYVLELEADDGALSDTDTVQVVVHDGIFFVDDFNDDDLSGWTTLAGSFDTFTYDSGYEVHATTTNSRMRANLANTALSDTVYISFKIRHTGLTGGTGWKYGYLWLVDANGDGWGLYYALDQNGDGGLYLHTTDNDGASNTWIEDFGTPGDPNGAGLKQIELVYDRVNDEVECFYEGQSKGTIDVSSGYRNFTRVIVHLYHAYTGSYGQLDVDDVRVATTPVD